MERMASIGAWFASLVGDSSINDVSRRSGVPLASLSRYVRDETFTPESVVKIARAFGSSIPDALIAHGIVTADELATTTVRTTLADATDLDLLEELVRRTEARGADEIPEDMQDEAIRNVRAEGAESVGGPRQAATVHDLNARRELTREPVEDLRAVASEESEDDGYDTNYDD